VPSPRSPRWSADPAPARRNAARRRRWRGDPGFPAVPGPRVFPAHRRRAAAATRNLALLSFVRRPRSTKPTGFRPLSEPVIVTLALPSGWSGDLRHRRRIYPRPGPGQPRHRSSPWRPPLLGSTSSPPSSPVPPTSHWACSRRSPSPCTGRPVWRADSAGSSGIPRRALAVPTARTRASGPSRRPGHRPGRAVPDPGHVLTAYQHRVTVWRR
jgi:hypothetical protein